MEFTQGSRAETRAKFQEMNLSIPGPNLLQSQHPDDHFSQSKMKPASLSPFLIQTMSYRSACIYITCLSYHFEPFSPVYQNESKPQQSPFTFSPSTTFTIPAPNLASSSLHRSSSLTKENPQHQFKQTTPPSPHHQTRAWRNQFPQQLRI